MKTEISKNEQGRSMVEMLGVLAVIGVLSVVGIWGYTTAMIRHQANEVLYEAHKRAVVVAGQITLGTKNPSLHEFEGNNTFSGGTFGDTVYGESGQAQWTDEDQLFTLSITDVEGSVCKELDAQAGNEVIYFEPDICDTKNPNEVKLTYNNDLSTDEDQDEFAEPCPAGRRCGKTCCGEDHTCQNGRCCDGEGHCCGVGSGGYSTNAGACCEAGTVPYYDGWDSQDSHGETLCCDSNKVIQRVNGYRVNIPECCGGDDVPYICDYEPNENGAYIEQCCCPKENTITNFKGASACCPPGSTAFCSMPRADGICEMAECLDSDSKKYIYWYDYSNNYITYGTCNQKNTISSFDRVESCCEGGRTAYCAQRDSAGRCTRAGCCSGTVIKGMGVNGADVCCNGISYCSQRDGDGHCTQTGCCSGTVTPNEGFNGADICCSRGVGYCSQRDSAGRCTATGCCFGSLTQGMLSSGTGVCCSSGYTAYCSRIDAEGNCTAAGCCPPGRTKTNFSGANVCCTTDKTGYCYQRDSNGRCTAASCCSGTVTQGSGSNPDTCS